MKDNHLNEPGHAYMKRALQLSTYGGPFVSPNPFVGAVIAARGRIIGEGYHRHYGQPHAEVNAIASVKPEDTALLREATMYVTLEPCSHFGKTPPCADLIIAKGIPHVVIAAEDPFLKNYESGIEKLKNAGIRVETGLLRDEARWINRRFFTAHTLGRPFVLLKWAQSADGYIAAEKGRTVKFSTPFTELLMHRERAYYDAIMVGVDTIISDNPRLNCRLWPAREPDRRPLKATFASPRIPQDSILAKGKLLKKTVDEPLDEFVEKLYREEGVTSLMVEGGRQTLETFIKAGLYDEIRIEKSCVTLGGGVPAPAFIESANRQGLREMPPENYEGNSIIYFVKNY